MQTASIHTEEWAGLGAALLLHAALLAVLLAKPEIPEALPAPQAITVSLSQDVGLEATGPVLIRESRASMGPVLSDTPAPSNIPIPSDVPAPSAGETAPPSRTQPVQPATRTPVSRSETARAPSTSTPSRSVARQEPRRSAAKREPSTIAAAKSNARSPSTSTSSRSTATSRPDAGSRSGGASRKFADAFDGAGSSSRSTNTGAPASKLGASEVASLDSAIGRQVKAKWQGRVPQGPDAEKLVTRVRFKLNADGSLNGEPSIIGQTTGVTELNGNQVGRHQEEAIRAIKLAARFNVPFPIPSELGTFTLTFDRNY